MQYHRLELASALPTVAANDDLTASFLTTIYLCEAWLNHDQFESPV